MTVNVTPLSSNKLSYISEKLSLLGSESVEVIFVLLKGKSVNVDHRFDCYDFVFCRC